jgi:hypothetical protein
VSSTTTSAPPVTFDVIFPSFPRPILKKLEISYNEIMRNFREGKFEPSELNGAKFCEVVFRILEWYTSGNYTAFGTRIQNFGQSVRKFESLSAFNDSIRFQIPKILNALYEIRNKRGVGHVGGDIDPNFMDSTFVVSSCDWIMAELVRIFHGVSIQQAREIVQSLITKKIPLIWEIGGKKRVLNPGLPYRTKALVLLYGEYPASIPESILCQWIEYSNPAVFRRDIVIPMHKAKLVEYDSDRKTITLSPIGVDFVEKNVPLEV